VLPALSSALPGAPRLVVGAPSLVAGTPRCSQVHLKATASVQSTLGFDHPRILVRQLSDTPRGPQRPPEAPSGSQWLPVTQLHCADEMVDHSLCVLIGKPCMAQTAASPFSCSTAYSPQPIVPTDPMAWAVFLKCSSKAKRKRVTSHSVRLPLYVGWLDNLTEKPRLPYPPGVSSQEPWNQNGPGVRSEVLGARVTCHWSVISG